MTDFLRWLIATLTRPTSGLFGELDLRDGDRDPAPGTTARYAGQDRPGLLGATHVHDLNQALRTLGFLIAPTGGEFTRDTRWALQEFQRYATLPASAVERFPHLPRWSDRLVALPIAVHERYRGTATGVLNAWTRFTLRHWLANGRRCPVVVEARKGDGVVADNVWRPDEVPDDTPRFHALDFSGAWKAAEPDVAGDFTPAVRGGARSVPPIHTWQPLGEVLPEHLLPGSPAIGDLTVAALSTFKVVRAVADVECYGYFDSLNAYDNGYLSLGLCHWTAGLRGNPETAVEKAELWPYLSLLKSRDRAAFDEAVGRFGLDVVPWESVEFNANQRKYVGRALVVQEKGDPVPLPATRSEYDVFRGWHWFHRFQMACRTVDGFRRGMWTMSRIRLRDILSIPWDGHRVGDVVTSERGVALLLRWHVNRPADVCTGGQAGPGLAIARTAAGLTGDPAGWGDAEELALIAELVKAAPAALTDSMKYVEAWPEKMSKTRGYTLPTAGLRLSAARGSFALDTSGL
ncbi:peptidoglycan-binding protein [Herbidospora galbida]|uniref:Peptidoglycan-binding protein n=1 Tax=Herbidospora galbida TaxID=2575442 RepID=A0A4U3LY35_9ACTN|nr:peptidoglycan-binding domain-containing protein [Herbidospora galbida]TKK80752.1 peptidoglycan-binding protein [Herbidospora galbida]